MPLGLSMFRNLRWFSVSSISRRQGPWEGGTGYLGTQCLIKPRNTQGTDHVLLEHLLSDLVVTVPVQMPTTAPCLSRDSQGQATGLGQGHTDQDTRGQVNKKRPALGEHRSAQQRPGEQYTDSHGLSATGEGQHPFCKERLPAAWHISRTTGVTAGAVSQW